MDAEKIQVDFMSFSVEVVDSDVENVTVKNTTRQFGIKKITQLLFKRTT